MSEAVPPSTLSSLQRTALGEMSRRTLLEAEEDAERSRLRSLQVLAGNSNNNQQQKSNNRSSRGGEHTKIVEVKYCELTAMTLFQSLGASLRSLSHDQQQFLPYDLIPLSFPTVSVLNRLCQICGLRGHYETQCATGLSSDPSALLSVADCLRREQAISNRLSVLEGRGHKQLVAEHKGRVKVS